MRYIKVALIITLVLVLLTGCSADTILIKDEGSYYLQFNKPTTKPVHIGLQTAPEIKFDSIEEMLRTIKSGRFTKAQMEELIEFDWDDQGRVILFDLDHVLEPVYPTDYEGITVFWNGVYYSFWLNSPLASAGHDYFVICEQKYHTERTEYYKHFDESIECDHVTTENRGGIEVTVFDYTSTDYTAYGGCFQTPHRLCTYTLTDDDTELFVLESYDPNVDLQTPTDIRIFGKSSYGYFNISIDAFTARPSPQWLLSFDLKPYKVSNSGKTTQTYYDNAYYSITEKDGQYILTPKEPPEDPSPASPDILASRAFFYPKFTSVAEMWQEIIAGPISKHELYALCRISQSDNGEIEICNPNHLYECTAPAEFDLKYITWYGTDYVFSLTGETSHGIIYCYDEERYTESFNNDYKDFLTNSLETSIKQIKTPDRLSTVYYYNTSVAKLKYVCYEINVGDKKMYIQEDYLLEHEDGDEPVSSKVPRNIEFWGTENGGYFHGYFCDFTERPSVEWLSQFGITPYEGD